MSHTCCAAVTALPAMSASAIQRTAAGATSGKRDGADQRHAAADFDASRTAMPPTRKVTAKT